MVDLGIGSLLITDKTIEALCCIEDEDANDDREVLCPLLRHLEIGGSDIVTGEALVRLVLSREKGWEKGRCAKLERLDLAESRLQELEEEDVALLESKVKINDYDHNR